MYILAVILYGLGGIIAFHSTCSTFELRSKVLPFESAKNILLFTRLIVLCRFEAKVDGTSEMLKYIWHFIRFALLCDCVAKILSLEKAK